MDLRLIIALAIIIWIGLMPLVTKPVWAMSGRVWNFFGGRRSYGINIKEANDEGSVLYYVFWPVALLTPILIPIFLAVTAIIFAYCICLDKAGHWITKHLIYKD